MFEIRIEGDNKVQVLAWKAWYWIAYAASRLGWKSLCMEIAFRKLEILAMRNRASARLLANLGLDLEEMARRLIPLTPLKFDYLVPLGPEDESTST